LFGGSFPAALKNYVHLLAMHRIKLGKIPAIRLVAPTCFHKSSYLLAIYLD